jgi:SAM-dependent methyltransferase
MTQGDPHGSRRPYGRTLTAAEARVFYDRFGAKQDAQAFYEDRALAPLIAHSDFQHAQSIFEFGCGTGRLAARLLTSLMPDNCRYLGVDISTTMVALARERLQSWANRAEVVCSEGVTPPQCCSGAYDRFVSTYVLDLMSEAAITAILGDAHRLLWREGLLCLVSLTRGHGFLTKLVSAAWETVHRFNPKLVGGCRPIELREFLGEDLWRVRHHEVVSAWGLTSEVIVASRIGT